MRILPFVLAVPFVAVLSAASVSAAGLGDLMSAATGAASGAAGKSALSGAVESALKVAFPGVDVPPYVPCVVDSVGADDAGAFLKAGASGDYTAAASVASDLAQSPEAAACFSDAGLPDLP